MNFPWTVRLHALRLAERRLPEKISFDFSLTAPFNVVPLAVICFEADTLGEQKQDSQFHRSDSFLLKFFNPLHPINNMLFFPFDFSLSIGTYQQTALGLKLS